MRRPLSCLVLCEYSLNLISFELSETDGWHDSDMLRHPLARPTLDPAVHRRDLRPFRTPGPHTGPAGELPHATLPSPPATSSRVDDKRDKNLALRRLEMAGWLRRPGRVGWHEARVGFVVTLPRVVKPTATAARRVEAGA